MCAFIGRRVASTTSWRRDVPFAVLENMATNEECHYSAPIKRNYASKRLTLLGISDFNIIWSSSISLLEKNFLNKYCEISDFFIKKEYHMMKSCSKLCNKNILCF